MAHERVKLGKLCWRQDRHTTGETESLGRALSLARAVVALAIGLDDARSHCGSGVPHMRATALHIREDEREKRKKCDEEPRGPELHD